MVTLPQLIEELNQLTDLEQREILQRFFKTGKGEYAEGDVFLWIRVPILRKVAKKYYELSLSAMKTLLSSQIHEHRLVALFLLIHRYQQSDKATRTAIFEMYIQNTRYVNNWDLVDLSAPHIVGSHLQNHSREVLYQFARSNDLWKKRIAVLATFAFIRNREFQDTLNLAEILLDDEHDLIHKAVGWMLREVGKRDFAVEEAFIQKHHWKMPRIMLRYAIEQFSDEKRKLYMQE